MGLEAVQELQGNVAVEYESFLELDFTVWMAILTPMQLGKLLSDASPNVPYQLSVLACIAQHGASIYPMCSELLYEIIALQHQVVAT